MSDWVDKGDDERLWIAELASKSRSASLVAKTVGVCWAES